MFIDIDKFLIEAEIKENRQSNVHFLYECERIGKPESLTEEFHHVPNIDVLVKRLLTDDYVINFLNSRINGNKTLLVNKKTFAGIQTFFTNIYLHLALNGNVETRYEDGKSYFVYDDSSKSVEVADIDITINIKDNESYRTLQDRKEILAMSFVHELTHAYMDYNVFLKSGGKKRFFDVVDQKSYHKNVSYIISGKPGKTRSENRIYKKLARVDYFLRKCEMSAKVSEIRENARILLHLEPNLKVKEIYERLQIHRTFNTIGRWIDEAKFDLDSLYDTNEEIVEVINDVFGKHYTKSEKNLAYKSLSDRFDDVKKKVERIAWSIVYDVYKETVQ